MGLKDVRRSIENRRMWERSKPGITFPPLSDHRRAERRRRLKSLHLAGGR